MATGLTQTKAGIEQRLKDMISRGRSVSAYLNRNLLQQFKDAQNERWQTENSSQGDQWEALDPLYARQKKKRFASFPGSGNVMMVATGRLSQGAMGENSEYYYKVVTDRSFIFGINLGSLPYAKYPGMKRPFMSFSQDTVTEWKEGIKAYIVRGIQ